MPIDIIDLDELVGLVEQADVNTLPAIVGRLAEADARARVRMMTAASATVSAAPAAAKQPETWISAGVAAEIAGVHVETLRRLSRGQRWAARLGHRSIRIDEGAFRRWLATRR